MVRTPPPSPGGGRAVPRVSRARKRGRMERASGRRESARGLLLEHVRPHAQVSGRSRAPHLPRDYPRSPPAGNGRPRAGAGDTGDRAVLLVARLRRRLGRVHGSARRRNGDVQLRYGTIRHARRPHALRRAARGGHGHQCVRVVARARHRVPPGPPARVAAPCARARRSLSDLAGAGAVVRARPARDPAAARGGGARAWAPVRREGVPRPRSGGRGDPAAHVAGKDRAMDRGRALALVGAWLAAVPGGALAQRQPVLKQVAVPHAYYWREMYVPQLTSGPSAVTWSPDGTELIYSMQGSLWRPRIAFVSSAFNGRWHIFTVAMDGGVPGDVTRLTEDNDSQLPRYYYGVWDHRSEE